MFGPPGAGKGTQAQHLVKKYSYYQLSTGNLLRNEIENKTIIGNQISELIGRGEMVTDAIVDNLILNIIKNEKYKNKIIFDGYPRNIYQAKNLSKVLNENNQKIDYIFFLNVKKEAIIKRIEKRKILEKRSDDDAETILKRYDTYMEITKPVLDYYSKNQNFHEVDGSMEINDISQKIEEILKV